jgi:hypothetical protein
MAYIGGEYLGRGEAGTYYDYCVHYSKKERKEKASRKL